MTVNIGITPPDYTTEVGQFRALMSDTTSTPLDPDVPGYGEYRKFSDDEVRVFLSLSDDDISGAMYFAYTQMAGDAALQAKTVKDFDLQVDLTKRSSELRQVAASWKTQWDEAKSDVFEVAFPAGDCCRVGEASPVPVYCGGICGR